jgi:hypothetical protein
MSDVSFYGVLLTVPAPVIAERGDGGWFFFFFHCLLPIIISSPLRVLGNGLLAYRSSTTPPLDDIPG